MKRRNFKIRFWLGLAVVAVALGFPAGAQATTNVVPNPGFEQGGCGSTPVICGWVESDFMGQFMWQAPWGHSSSASMGFLSQCGVIGCYGWGSLSFSASTDPAFCAAINPGTHQASFWATVDAPWPWWPWGWEPEPAVVGLDATFYQAPDCTGPLGSDSIGGSLAENWDWQELTGVLVAPAGTQSALFRLSGGAPYLCDDYCGGAAAYVDDVYVEDALLPDTTPPETSITSGPSGTTNSTWATLEFIASEPATFECSLDTASFAACSSPASYTGLGEGSHTFRVHATDTAGNTDPTPAERSWTVDTTAPETTITSGPTGTTNSSSATFEFAADEPSGFECSLDTTPFAACSSPASYTGLGDGSHNFRVRATDTAGNTDPTPAERSWIVQANTPPVARFTFSCSALSCSFDGSASTDSDGTTYAWTFGDGTGAGGRTVAHTYAQAGSYTVTLTVTDDAGSNATESLGVTLIRLTAGGYKVKGLQRVDLAWSGPSGASFDLYRNGTKIATVQATAYTDNINQRGSGTYTYRVCAPGSSTCSNDVSVSF
jgi:hypothetical protein